MAASEKSYDLGHRLSREGIAAPFANEATPKALYPSFSLCSTEFPPLTDWQVGKTYEMTITVKMTGLHEREKSQQGTFDVLSART